VPQRQPKRGRLWLNDGSCIRLRPEYPGHVWAYDFVEGRTRDGRKFRIPTIIDEASRECLALVVARQLKHEDVLAVLAELFVTRGPPAHVGSDNPVLSLPKGARSSLPPSSSPPPCGNGSAGSASRRSISPRARPGRTATTKASTARLTRRAAQWQNLLQPRPSQDPDRGLAAALQHRAPARQPRPPTTRPPSRGAAGNHDAPTITPDHSVGAGQFVRRVGPPITHTAGVAKR